MKTAKELDLRLVGKVIIFRDTHTNRTFLLYIDVNETIIHVNQVKLVDRTQYFVRQKHVNFQLHLTHEYKDRLCS